MTLTNFRLVQEIHPDPSKIRKLIQGLEQHAKKAVGSIEALSFAFFIESESDEVWGGVLGVIYYGTMQIDTLWVDESMRCHGFGTQLMNAVEQLARKQGCTFIRLQTMEWEAPEFYKKLGYSVEFVRYGYPNGSHMFLMRKDLV
jgi:ribosomal protein S18 acetylase RimI-like enzyme